MSDKASCSLKLSNKSNKSKIAHEILRNAICICDPTPCDNAKNARMSNDARTLKTLQNLTMGILKTLQSLTVRKKNLTEPYTAPLPGCGHPGFALGGGTLF